MNSHYLYHQAIQRISAWICNNNPDAPLDLSHMGLDILPPLPLNIRILDISHNKLTVLPELPPSLLRLICNSNYITKMECIPEHIEYIDISDNLLMYKPYRLSLFTVVRCARNQFLYEYLQPIHEEYIMDLRYSEGLVQTLLDDM